MTFGRLLCLSAASVFLLNAQFGFVSTAQYSNGRSNSNVNERILSTYNVNVKTFGKLGSYSVDGAVYAQPLYIPFVYFGGFQFHNVLFIATMNNTVYAFDADQPGSTPLWKRTLAPPVLAGYSDSGICPSGYTGQLGILSTPVINIFSGTIYLVYATPSGPATYAHHMAALDIVTGAQKFSSPNLITAQVTGKGYDSVNGTVSLNQITSQQRAGLTLANGNVYASFSSCGPNPDPYHGWVVGYDASNLGSQTAVFNSTPNASEGGIWQSGRGLVADSFGALYALTGNGPVNDSADFPDSVVKIAANGTLLDWYSPKNAATLGAFDLDVSSGGPIYTGSSNLLLAGGKEGVVYVLNPFALGKYGSPIQTLQAAANCGTFTYSGCHQIHSLAYWDSQSNPLLYVWASDDNLRAYRLTGSQFDPVPDSQNSAITSYPGATLALSSAGDFAGSGILWAVTLDGVLQPDGALHASGTLHAYLATDVSKEIYNSNQNPVRDNAGTIAKFAEPTIVNGKVYVPSTDGQVKVYGLLPSH